MLNKNFNDFIIKFFIINPLFVRVAVLYIVIIADNFIMDKCLLLKLAKRIKELRKIHKYTQDDLSALAGIGRSTLGNIETAQNDVTFTKIAKIAYAFNLSLADFLNF